MRRLTARAVAVVVACASASQGGDVFTYSPDAEFAKHHILPRMARRWLLLGCDSVIPVGIGLTNSGDPQYPYKLSIWRKIPEPVGACDKGERIIVRNIDGVVPGALALALEDSLDDSTRSYRTGTDSASIVTTRTNDGLVVEFASGSLRQTIRGEGFEGVHVPFAGDINKDGHIDFVIGWTSTYANRYDVLVSKKAKGAWRLDKKATITFTD